MSENLSIISSGQKRKRKEEVCINDKCVENVIDCLRLAEMTIDKYYKRYKNALRKAAFYQIPYEMYDLNMMIESHLKVVKAAVDKLNTSDMHLTL